MTVSEMSFIKFIFIFYISSGQQQQKISLVIQWGALKWKTSKIFYWMIVAKHLAHKILIKVNWISIEFIKSYQSVESCMADF